MKKLRDGEIVFDECPPSKIESVIEGLFERYSEAITRTGTCGPEELEDAERAVGKAVYRLTVVFNPRVCATIWNTMPLSPEVKIMIIASLQNQICENCGWLNSAENDKCADCGDDKITSILNAETA